MKTLIIIFFALFVVDKYGQDLDSICANLAFESKAIELNDTTFNKMNFNCKYVSANPHFEAIGNVKEQTLEPQGKWLFFYYSNIYVAGKYRKGKQHGIWKFYHENEPSGSMVRYKNGVVKNVTLVY